LSALRRLRFEESKTKEEVVVSEGRREKEKTRFERNEKGGERERERELRDELTLRRFM